VKRVRAIILNDTPTTGFDSPGPAAERLQTAMLGALGAHTDERGRVHYGRLADSEAFAAAETAARALGGVRLDQLTARGERLAFWINVYNALVLHGIVRLGVRASVRRVWNFFGRVSYRVGGHILSLDDIEHGVLRDNRRRPWPLLRPFGAGDPRRSLAVSPPDPRFHFAITCGAASCPPVGVYRADAIDRQLELATRNFVNQEIVLSGARLACSRLFKWYRADFEAAGGLAAFLLRYLDDGPARRALAAGAAPCTAWRPYEWTLQHQAAD
jgi:Protein of unknown function, DUF547